MKHTNIRNVMTAAFVAVVLAPCVAIAQFKVDVDKPEVVEILSPDNAGSAARKSFKPKDWMEVEMKFKIEAKDRDKKFADKVTVKWYLATKHPDPRNKGFVLLEKEVTHVNVPIGKDVYTSIYLSPNSVMRLTGNDKVSKSNIENAGGEILVEGQQPVGDKKGYFMMSGKSKWWTSGNLSRYDKIPLLNKAETPFKFLWWDRYAEIEVER